MTKISKENILISFLLLFILAVSFYDVIFLGKTFKLTASFPQAFLTGPYGQEKNVPPFISAHNMESAYIDEPIEQFIRVCFKKGIFPLWNPHQGCGYPLIGMLEMGLFFPLNAALYFLPEIIAWDVLIFIRFFLAGFLTYLFMRCLRFKKIPALGSAIIFMLSGPMVLFQYRSANNDILLPLLLLSLELFIQKPNRKRLCLITFAIALTFFAGHAEHIFLEHFYGLLFLCFRLLSVKQKIEYRRVILYLIAAYGLAIGLSAVVVFPFLRNFFTEFWNYHPADMGLKFAWSPRSHMIAMINPFLFQKPLSPGDFIFSEWWGGYIGLFPILLAFLGLTSSQRKKLNYFFAFIAFVIVSKTYGFSIVNWVGRLPLFNLCYFYTHTLHFLAFTFAVLAGMGIRVVLAGRRTYRKGLFFSFGFACLIILYLCFFPSTEKFALSVKGCIFSFCILIIFQFILLMKEKKILSSKGVSLILIFCIFNELFIYISCLQPGRSNRFDSFPKVPYITSLNGGAPSLEKNRSYGILWTLFPNTASGYQIDDLGGAWMVLPKRFVCFVNNFIQKDYFEKRFGARSSLEAIPFTFFEKPKPYLDLLNVEYTVAPKKLPLILLAATKKKDFLNLIYSQEANIYERPDAFPRVFVVHRSFFEPNEDMAVEKIKMISPFFRKVIVIQHPAIAEIEQQLALVPVEDHSYAKITSYTPNEVAVQTNLENAGFLVLSDAFHPDWKVYVDGKESKIFITDYLIRSVFLPQGLHRVHFVFWPASFYFGGIISLVSVILFISLLKNDYPH